jgi:hypothetical protein
MSGEEKSIWWWKFLPNLQSSSNIVCDEYDKFRDEYDEFDG